MKNFHFSIICLILLLGFSSCSGNKRLEGERILIFSTDDKIEVNSKLKNKKFILSEQQKDENWYGESSVLNQKIENYSFDEDILKIKKIKTKPKFKGISSIVVNNVLYEIRDNSKLSAINIENNKSKRIWKTKKIKVGDEKIRYGKLSYYKNKIFLTTGLDEIIAFNSKNGIELWRKSLKSVTVSSPIIDRNGNLYIITNDNKLYALNQNTGEIVWIHPDIEIKTAILGSANPVIYKQYVVTSYSSGNLYVLNRKTGREEFSLDLNLPKITNFTLNDIDATPLISNGILYASGNGGLLAAINLENFEILWKKEFPTITDFWIAGDYIYIINNESKVAGISKREGEFLWVNSLPGYKNKKKTKKIVYSEIVMVDDFLLARNNDEKVMIINPSDGQILGKVKNKRNIHLMLFSRFFK
ncbi:PQQ-binding-like beta-propeller repeat protein [Pseudomonadota bacterium]